MLQERQDSERTMTGLYMIWTRFQQYETYVQRQADTKTIGGMPTSTLAHMLALDVKGTIGQQARVFSLSRSSE